MISSYQENHNDSQLDMRDRIEKEHQEYHVQENEFDEKCEWCKVEKCNVCKGRGMSENGQLICGTCNGRGRLI